MKLAPKLSNSVLPILVFSLAVAGCQTPKERREERARQEADERTEAARQEVEREENERVSTARNEYQSQLRVFEGIEGGYEGRYTSAPSGATVVVAMRLEVSEAPSPATVAASHREGELLGFRDHLGFTAHIEERNAAGLRAYTCDTAAVRPDFGSGLVRISCPLGGANASSRNYVFGFDNHGSSTIATSAAEIESRAKAVSENLVTGRQNVLEAMNFMISARPADIHGRMERSH